jgi:hypothetical protein
MIGTIVRTGLWPVAAGVVCALLLTGTPSALAQTSTTKPPATGTTSGSTGGGTGTVTGGAAGSASGSGSAAANSAANDLTSMIAPFVQLAGDVADALGLTFDSDLAVLRFFAMLFEFFSWLEMSNGPSPPATGGSGGMSG